MAEDSWEYRMAARATARAVVRNAALERERIASVAAARRALDDIAGTRGWSWLNGWPRMGDDGSAVLMGTSVRCLGCGDDFGTTCVVFPDGWEPPGPEPAWPFGIDECPIHRMER